jgi:hypothetical protein
MEITMPAEQPRVEGRVAAILNARELVVNIGAAAGVKPGMKFAVLADTPLEIRDPVNNSVLDTVDREKVRVEAAEVRGNITICRTYRLKGGNPFRPSSGVFQFFSDAIPETLRISDASTPPPLSEEESYVKTNDRVVSIPES